MSLGGQEENQGTGLKDVFDILLKTPPERLLSLTFQLGESPEENIVHALCLIVLQKEARALNKLQMLKDNYLAAHLADKLQMSGVKLKDFAVHCVGHSQDRTGDFLAPLARVFKVLSEQRLCDPCLRNLAYKRACDNQKTINSEDLEYDRLREEANVVCGPELAEGTCSSKDLKSEVYRDPLSRPNVGNTTLKVTLSQDKTDRAHSLPSSLQATSSMPSYPTHLEISIPPTVSFQDDKIRSDESKLNTPVLLVGECEAKNVQTSQPESSEPSLVGAKKPSKMDEASAAEKEFLHQTTKPTTEPNFAAATNISLPKTPVPNEMPASKCAEEEEEATFYAFVILHAPEDEDVAESMKERVEKVIGSEGATFSGDFAIPGKSTLRCVEDAINNSAFTLLLLTRNFNTRMLEMETDSALINSINKTHKYNTVIPLLPLENRMPRMNLPMVLQAINSLEENKSFVRKIQKMFSPVTIRNQKRIWQTEQAVKREIERQERLKNMNHYQKQLIRECTSAQLLEKEKLRLLVAEKLVLGPGVPLEQDGRWQQQPQSIHIENAKYIVIGNDSHMNVDLSGGGDKDDTEEE